MIMLSWCRLPRALRCNGAKVRLSQHKWPSSVVSSPIYSSYVHATSSAASLWTDAQRSSPAPFQQLIAFHPHGTNTKQRLIGMQQQRLQFFSTTGPLQQDESRAHVDPNVDSKEPSSGKQAVVDPFKIEKQTWAERHAPEWVLPYIQLARVNRPAGTYMLLWPCLWSTALAAPAGSLPPLDLLALFTVGSFIMRGAGCTINDMWDKDFDKKVERTNQRPLAAGKLTYNQAAKFLVLQLSAGLAVLVQLNPYTIALGASSLVLVTAYPFMKRVTYWPQAVLGLTFNWGALVGWAAVHGSCAWPVVLPLYAGGVCWTLVYDTLYAHQDKKDDQFIGVHSTALLFGDKTKPILNAFAACTIAGFGLAGYGAELSMPFYLGLSGAASHLAWQINTAKLDDAVNLQERFASNKWFGALMFGSILAGKLL